MIRMALLALGLASPLHAMTGDDCKRIQSGLASMLPAVNDLRLAPTATPDGWCRVIDGPIGSGLEWRWRVEGSGFEGEVRHKAFTHEGLGPFALTGRVERSSDQRVRLGPIRLLGSGIDAITLTAETTASSGVSSGAAGTNLESAVLRVAGARGVVNDVLAWAFRLDIDAARSSFISARDQRADMRAWLNDEARSLVDPASARAFEALIDAYPQARGAAELRIRDDQPVPIGPLVSAVLFGASFTDAEAAKLVKDAGLTLTWEPN